MTVPRPRVVRQRKLPVTTKWRVLGSIATAVFVGVSWVRSVRFSTSLSLSSSPPEAEDEAWQTTTSSHRRSATTDQAPYVARNGAIIRRYNMFYEHDRKQDIHQFGTAMMHDKPRVVHLETSTTATTAPSRWVQPLTNVTPTTVDPNTHIWGFELPYYQECTPMKDWQTEFYPTCNILHAVHPGTLISTKGSWRTVWIIEGKELVVLKMLNLDRNFDPESYWYHQVDAVAMERLTSSRYVIHAHGFCGQSILTEYATTDGRTMIKNKKLSNKARLKMARDLAKGLDDMHSMDYPKGVNATFCHNDMNIANIVGIDGKIKHSDFNIGYFLKWNHTKPCGFPQRWEGKLWRSPEELTNTTYVSEKTDIYSLGNILFQVMTKHQPWTWLEQPEKPSLEQVAARKIKGGLPTIPEKYSQSRDLAVQGLYRAVRACFQKDPDERPTAYQLARGLSQVLKWIDHGNTTANVTERIFFHS